MASTRTLRRRIRSVKNTAQITKAMQMVAATKMRRAQNQALNGRPYTFNLNLSLERLLPEIETLANPLLSENGSSRVGVALLSTDKGLVGALNTNIIRSVMAGDFPKDTIFYTVGKKGRNFVVRSGKDLKADFENPATVAFRQAKQLARLMIESYLSKEIGQAFLIYPQFVSTLRQEATKVKLLPVSVEELKSQLGTHLGGEDEAKPGSHLRGVSQEGEFLIEPDAVGLLDELLVHFVETRIYQALLETKASEFSAQMIAMKNATDNAEELVGDLQLTYNQTRQDNITRELLEITSAAAAME